MFIFKSTNKYPVIFEAPIATSIISSLIAAISGRNLYRETSFLLDSLDTKIASDSMAMSFYNSFNLPVTIARPFNIYGPRQSARAIIPTIITQIASGKSMISLGALHPTRDFNFIDDTISGFLSTLNTDKCIGEVVNIGSNYEISIGDTAQSIAEIMKAEIELITDEQRLRPLKSEVERLWAENDKAKKNIIIFYHYFISCGDETPNKSNPDLIVR